MEKLKSELSKNEMILEQKLNLLTAFVEQLKDIVHHETKRDDLPVTSDKSRDYKSEPYFVKNVGAMAKANSKGRESTKMSAVRADLKKLAESDDKIDRLVAERALEIINQHTTVGDDYSKYDFTPDADFEEVNNAQISTFVDAFMPTLKAEKRAKVLKKIVEEKAMAKIKAKRQTL